MNLCSDNHEEVCYEGKECPVCSLRTDMEAEIDAMNEKVKNLNDELEDALNQT